MAILTSQVSVFADQFVQVNQDASRTRDIVCNVNNAPNEGYIFTWFRNDESYSTTTNQFEISASGLTKGERWDCVVSQETGFAGNIVIGSDSTVILNSVPYFISTPVTTGAVGNSYSYDANAVDADNDPLAYSLTTSPTGMTVNPATGVISWVPSVTGTFAVTISVTDGTTTITQSYTVTVSASSFTVTATATPSSATVNQTVAFTATVSGGIAPYSYAWDFTNDGTYDTAAQNPTFTYTATGTYTARVRVTDATTTTATNTVTITVTTTAPTAPSFTTTACPDGKVKQAYICDVDVSSIGQVNFILVNAPTNMTINATTGVISWTPTDDGTFNFVVRATDTANLLSTDRSFQIQVEDNKADERDLFVESIIFRNSDVFQGDIVYALVTLENQGSNDFDDLELTMTIEELSIESKIDAFDLDDGDKETKEISLELPVFVEEGYYTVKFTIKNDDISVIKFKDIYINGEKTAAVIGNKISKGDTEVVFQPILSSYQPPASKGKLNWLGIWFMIIVLVALTGLAAYLIRRLQQDNQEKSNEFKFTTVDNEFDNNVTTSQY